MSDNDEKDGELLRFPRVFLPGSFDAPGPPSGNDSAGEQEGEAPASPRAWPRLPEVAPMSPPLHLTVPGVPTPGSADEEPGAFAVPAPIDPENPTPREVLAAAMAVMTALGVAAAQGLWHRARYRQALADRARAAADKAEGKASGRSSAAGTGSGSSSRGSKGAGGSGGSKSPSLLRSPGGPSGKSSRSAGRTGGGGSRPDKGRKDPKGPKNRSPKAPRGKDPRAPRATPDGKRKEPAWPKKRRRAADKDGGVRGLLRRKRRDAASKKQPPALAGSKGGPDSTAKPKVPKADAAAAGTKRGKDKAKATPRPAAPARRELTWKAPKKDPKEKGPTRSTEEPTGPKRWTSGRKKPKDTAPPKRRKSRSRQGGTAWWKRWKARRPPSAPQGASNVGADAGTQPSQDQEQARRTSPPPPPPPPGWGMRPPPGADRRTWVRVERVDEPPRRARPEPPAPATPTLTGTPISGRPALPVGQASTRAVTPPLSAHRHRQGARFVSTPRTTNTQYHDADLTIHDVIDADADMAEQILAGVDEARATARGCEDLMSGLEALRAEVIRKKVPGVLEGMLVTLIDKTFKLKATAEALAAKLPSASEAIATAGSNAAARHKPLADAVRDAGHVRPAERDYHHA
ncbi:hypothetical protein ACFFMN_34090 [Planobispora siamensis]|uniref:Uncharacterized protein n=1 Tax=Planobispora siamensis TaxID=936338 RepID=A0A8J3SG89_9ACTN|nr:hypothetical protein [Planobispora siamensis]GIH91915.1 hypothetical protein Psi01_25450 [Planobispora siamensis]